MTAMTSNAPRLPTGAFSSRNSQPTGGLGNKIPSGYREARIQQFTPEQIELFQSLFGHLGPDSFLSQLAGGDEGAFEQMEAPAHRAFNEKIGEIGSRFSALGSGAQRSSGFRNTLGQASSDFAQNLQSQRLGYQRQALQDLMGLSNTLLGQRPYETQLAEKRQKAPSFLQSFGSSILGGAAKTLGGNLPGAFSSLFGG